MIDLAAFEQFEKNKAHYEELNDNLYATYRVDDFLYLQKCLFSYHNCLKINL